MLTLVVPVIWKLLAHDVNANTLNMVYKTLFIDVFASCSKDTISY